MGWHVAKHMSTEFYSKNEFREMQKLDEENVKCVKYDLQSVWMVWHKNELIH